MSNKIKAFAFFLTISFIFITNTACTQDKNNDTKVAASSNGKSEGTENKDIALNNSDLGQVFSIESVGSPVQGKATNFTWSHNGQTMNFADLTKNKVVFLNFWGTWCPPCRKEIPDIIEIGKELNGKDFIIVGISMERDQQNAKATVEQFIQKNGINYMNFIANPEIINSYGGITGVPTTFIIDKNGNISDKVVGMRDKATFMDLINKVLK